MPANSAGISLRRATADDLPFFRALYGSFRALEMALVPWTAEQKQFFLDDQFRLQHLHFTGFFARADFLTVTRSSPFAGPQDAGRLYLDRSAPCWRIIDIGLVPELRGEGIGTVLIEGVQASATAADAEGVALQVARDNPRARALYLRLGFVDDGAPEGFHQPMLWRPAQL
jgi:ribosomal protein S18 acetylase RimI-like enzyme